MGNENLKKYWYQYRVPVLFLIFGFLGYFFSGLSFRMVFGDLIERFGRNLFLVLSLLLPLWAGMGINFSIMIGAMAGQLALITALSFSFTSTSGVLFSMAISVILSILFGKGIAVVLNRCKGREMIASLVLGYFASGAYQLFCLIVPMKISALGLDGGIGLKSTIDLKALQYGLDRFPVPFKIFGFRVAVVPILFCALLAYFLITLKITKFGQQIRAVGENSKNAEAIGISADQVRTKTVIFSTIFAAWGQIISLQNIGTLSTFGSHEQVGIYAGAALLAGGATLKKAEVKNAVFGVLLFYFLFIVAPKAGNQIFGDAQTGEFFRVFLAYGILAFALVLSEKNSEKEKRK